MGRWNEVGNPQLVVLYIKHFVIKGNAGAPDMIYSRLHNSLVLCEKLQQGGSFAFVGKPEVQSGCADYRHFLISFTLFAALRLPYSLAQKE